MSTENSQDTTESDPQAGQPVEEGGRINEAQDAQAKIAEVSIPKFDSSSMGGDSDEYGRLRKEAADAQDRYLRLLAEFDNYKKRTLKEQADLRKYQGERIFVDMLDVLDNLELALGHADADQDKLRAGIQLIHKLFIERLGKWEVRGDSGIGSMFDPVKHAAISKVPKGDAKAGTIVSELKKAYYYKDKLLRPGEVVVAGDE